MEEINESTEQTPLLLYRNCDISQEHLSDIPLNQCMECMVFTSKTGCCCFFVFVFFQHSPSLARTHESPKMHQQKMGKPHFCFVFFSWHGHGGACFKTCKQELDLLTSFPRLRQKNLAMREDLVSKKLLTNKELHSLRIHVWYNVGKSIYI